MLKVGLTGGIGSGKTVVAQMFDVLGIPVFRADEAAKNIMVTDSLVMGALSQRFGQDIFPDGKLDQKRLAGIIFNDDEALGYVNSVVHPAVRSAFDTWAKDQEAPYVVMEAALMAENEGWRRFDQVIAVNCPEEERVRRVMERDGVTEQEVRARMRHQASEEERMAIAHHVVRNSGSELVIPQVLTIHERLKGMS